MEAVLIELGFDIRKERGQFGRAPNLGLAKSEFAKSFFINTNVIRLIPFYEMI